MSEISIDIAKFLGLVLTLLGMFWGMSRRQQGMFEKHLDEKFAILQLRLEQIEKKEGDNGKEVARVERQLMELRADLPEKYLRREDYIRGQSVIESKLDALALKLENMQIREAKRD